MTLDATMLDGVDPMFPTLYALDPCDNPPPEMVNIHAARVRALSPLLASTILTIQMAECECAGIGIRDMLGPSQVRHIVKARQGAMRRAKAATGLDNVSLGRAFNRTKATVWYTVGKGAAK